MFEHLKSFGVLRILLLIAAVAVIFIKPEPGTAAARSGIEIIPTLVAPVVAPLIFMVLLFDFMMCRIRMSDEDVRKKFRLIGYTELTAALLVLLAWLPFFLAIGQV